MKTALTILVCLFVVATADAGKTKTIEKHITTRPDQRIEINGITGSNVTFRSWTKDEVYLKLDVRISSSDDEYEDEYIRSVDVRESESPGEVRLTLSERSSHSDGGFSIFDIFRRFYVNKEITGEVYIPQKNAFTSDFRYGTMTLEGMQGELRLIGTNNSLTLRNCSSIRRIDNDYGTTQIDNSGGSLKLASASSTVGIANFDGSVDVDANYSTVTIGQVTKDVYVNDQSGKVRIDDVGGNVTLDANYSTIAINRVRGFVDVRSASGTVKVRTADGVSIKANYSNIDVFDVKGSAGKPILIKSQSGSLSLEDAVGNVEIDNPYSDIDLKHIRGRVDVSTTSGRIDAEEIVGDWNSQTEYSTVTVRGLTAKSVTMTNSSNPVSVSLKTVPSAINIQNKYGSVKVQMPSGFSGNVELDAEYGSIDTNLPLKVKTRSSSESAMGKVGSGSGSITIETTSGNINLMEQ